MKIGMIGAGSLGSALGERLSRTGHEIMFGGGDTAREVASGMAAGVGSNSDAAAFGDVVVLAVPFAAIEAALVDAATEGRVLWSCVNALRHDMSGLAVGFDTRRPSRLLGTRLARASWLRFRRSHMRSRRARSSTTRA